VPRLAYVETIAACPRCGCVHDRIIQFQWGYCFMSQPSTEDYQIGQPIRWRKLQDGSIPAWTYFADNEANIGDPAFVNLITTDVGSWSWIHCPRCAFPTGGAAVRIENGIITQAWLFAKGEFDTNTDIYLIEPEGTLTPKPDWADPPLQFLNDDGTPAYPGGYRA